MTALAASGLVVRRGGRRLLDAVSLDLRPGALVGIVGPNGAGKSTLLRCLVGLLAPDAGRVLVDDRPLADLPGRERARRIGYVPQRFEPAWDFGVREVVEMGAARVPGDNARLADAIAANELEALLDRRWSRLSGGERARALFAAVTVTNPPVLLADEPGASLDIRHRLSLLMRLRDYAAARTVAVVLHDLDLALRFCDRVVVMAAGRIALDGARTEAAESPILDEVFGVRFARLRVPAGVEAVLPLPDADGPGQLPSGGPHGE